MGYMSGTEVRADWADELCKEVALAAGLPRVPSCTFYLPKLGKRRSEVVSAHAYSDTCTIEMSTINTKQTKVKVHILLHEIAHCIDYHRNGRQHFPSGQRSVHPRSFWDIALPLYKQHRVLKVAARREYDCGKKLLWDLYDVRA